MPANIEIKARVAHFDSLRRRAESLSGAPCQVIPQEDIFFNVPHGRLKLRIFSPESAQLIFYHRPDQGGPKRSEYHLTPSSDPAGLKDVLARAYGIRGVVRKTRYLYLSGQTRIHLDDVAGLGHFVELEVVLRDSQSTAEGQAIAAALMQQLDIRPEDLLEGAYMDLLENREG